VCLGSGSGFNRQATAFRHATILIVPARWLILPILCTALHGAEEYTYWVDPCTAQAAQTTACQPGDTELGAWAFEAWQRESNGGLLFKKSSTEAHARIRIHWANGAMNLYGETRSLMVDGKRGAVIYVLPDTHALGPEIDRATQSDRLLRDAIVYLTCLHESGHALGLEHTAEFPDIMYSFQHGGDIVEYFERYRRLLKTRADIAAHAGISDADRATLRKAFH
jgi:predicted Zn-dependent protease